MRPLIPILQTERLVIRPFTLDDLHDIHTMLDFENGQETQPLEERHAWLAWTVRNYPALEALYQPPYGDRAVTLRADGRLVGAVGLAPALGPFGLLPYFQHCIEPQIAQRWLPEVGLYWALGEEFRGQGYATEAARALIAHAFDHLQLARIVATTEYSNIASRRVMERLGMRIETNPLPEPAFFQVVGILEYSPAG